MVAGKGRSLIFKFLLGCFVAGGFGNALLAQHKSTFKVEGPCMACGYGRIEGIVKKLDGINSTSFEPSTSMLTVDFDPAAASLIDIQLELTVNGYDAGDFKHDEKVKLPPCATAAVGMRGDQDSDELGDLGIDDIEGLETEEAWEDLDAMNIADADDLDLLNDDVDDDSDLSTWGDEKDNTLAEDLGDDEDDL